jgi:phospholipase C
VKLEKVLPWLLLFPAVLAEAQTLPKFQHIVLIVQENRTPDNLFGSGPSSSRSCGIGDPFEPGVDIDNGGPAKGMGIQCSIPLHLNVRGLDPDHGYEMGWVPQYDGGAQDGFCQIVSNGVCQQYSYVIRSDVQPYFDIAANYGFANYMFQTNEGPSFPAHQFLLSGTSAAAAPGQSEALDFVSENGGFSDSGCPYLQFDPAVVDPSGAEIAELPDCYTHPTLVDQLTSGSVTWRYYTPTPGVIWDAPAAISTLCGTVVNKLCTGPAFANVIWPGKFGSLTPTIPFLQDVQSCNLQQMSWVIPDERWSDHPTFGSMGPSYVANLVDAIGNSTCKDSNGQTYWQDTAIFITWDDWGGWYDHVTPPAVYRGTGGSNPSCTTQNAPNGWGCGNVYGFRVPLLVVSAYTPAAYVSGALPSPGKIPQYEHDFGSILKFTENNFGLRVIDQSGDKGYADENALDNVNGNIPLSDFFPLSSPRNFVPINPITPQNTNFFQNYYVNEGVQPMGPDGTDAD